MAASSRTIVIAGAGIGGLTAALALAQAGFRAVVFDQAKTLEETGAGIQLSPNATQVLIGLGLHDRLQPKAALPEGVAVHSAKQASEIARIPLGEAFAFRYGAPYWILHRADLQGALVDAVRANPDISLRLGIKVEDFVVHANGVTVQLSGSIGADQEHGIALVAADGLWSTLRTQFDELPPRFAERTAWRALVPVERVPEEFRAPLVHLWLAPDAHLVHYPVRAGREINIVAIIRDRWQSRSWSAPGSRQEVVAQFPQRTWAPQARAMLALPETWLKWSLYDRPPRRIWTRGPVALLGDAAHPMLPFLAQGAAMAIEDAATLAHCMRASESDPAKAMRTYAGLRRARTARVQNAARFAGRMYQLSGPSAVLRNIALAAMGGERLRERYDWIYSWRSG
ncbi:MAG: FAD-dependent monooxygenase [Pseudorhodoplanes sp.]|nr:FAD-dependent monooxygenase [Pseudorhodoplanes sp.]